MQANSESFKFLFTSPPILPWSRPSSRLSSEEYSSHSVRNQNLHPDLWSSHIHIPLIVPLMDHNSHCVCWFVCGNCLSDDTFRVLPPWGNFLGLFYPFVACPTSFSLISFSRSPDSCGFYVALQVCIPWLEARYGLRTDEPWQFACWFCIIWVLAVGAGFQGGEKGSVED